MDTMQMKSLNGPASNYPPPSSEDLSGEDMNLRLETVGLYRGLSFVRAERNTRLQRVTCILKILENMQARAERLKEATRQELFRILNQVTSGLTVDSARTLHPRAANLPTIPLPDAQGIQIFSYPVKRLRKS